jgi:hypothetical protein
MMSGEAHSADSPQKQRLLPHRYPFFDHRVIDIRGEDHGIGIKGSR